MGLVLGGVLVWTIVVTSIPIGSPAHTALLALTRYLAAEIFLVAGLVHLTAWRSTREPAALRSAFGLAAVGMTLPALAVLTPWTPDGVHVGAAAPLARLLVFVPVIGLLSAVRLTAPLPPSEPARTLGSIRLLPVPAVLAAATALGLGLVTWTGPGRADASIASTVLGAGAEVLLAIAWIALAVRAARSHPAASLPWPIVAMLTMAGGEFVRSATIATDSAGSGTALGFGLVGAIVFLHDAGVALRRAQRAESAETLELTSALTGTRQLLDRLERGQRARLHDVRSAVVGVIGASRLLTGPQAAADEREALQRLIAAELTRLQTLLDTDVAEPVTDFDLDAVFGPVLAAHRIAGDAGAITADLDAARCTARPAATASVLDNLLRNACTHAPGARVSVHARQDGDTVTVVVEDDGPGIPAGERAAVLRPGGRGSAAVAPGSGLGLANCVRTVAEQGGMLMLDARPGGGTRVSFTLPRATTVVLRPLHALAS